LATIEFNQSSSLLLVIFRVLEAQVIIAIMAQPASAHDLSKEEIKKLAELAIDAKSKAYCEPLQGSWTFATLLTGATDGRNSSRTPRTCSPYLTGPYSSFQVGAALLLSTGHYHTGANVEIASTPVGICAERCAIAPVIASVKRPYPPNAKDANIPVIRGLAVATNIDPPASPCGMCRQFMREFCAPEMKVWMYGKTGFSEWGDDEGVVNGAVVMTMAELLPNSFGPNDLSRNEERTVPKFGWEEHGGRYGMGW
jgi:cytidine deaminase